MDRRLAIADFFGRKQLFLFNQSTPLLDPHATTGNFLASYSAGWLEGTSRMRSQLYRFAEYCPSRDVTHNNRALKYLAKGAERGSRDVFFTFPSITQ